MKNRNQKSYPVVDNYLDILVNVFTLIVSFLIVPTLISFIPVDVYTRPLLYLVMLIACLLASLIYQFFNVYAEGAYLRFRESVYSYLRANALIYSTLFLLSLLAPDVAWPFWGTLIGIQFVLSTALLLVKREITISAMHSYRIHRYQLRKTVIVGDNTETAKQYLQQINVHPEYGVMVLGYVGDCIRSDVGCDKLGSFENLGEILDRYRPDEVVFAIDSYNKKRLTRLVDQCDDRFIKVFFLPVLYGYFKSTEQLTRVGDIPLINIHLTPMENRGAMSFKRGFDVVASVLLLLLTLPITLLTAAFVFFAFGGPIWERHERVGLFGETFAMFKFHTEKTPKADGENPKITATSKIGAFLRASGIDELPQLINVLLGEMSLVGPRPDSPADLDAFRALNPSYNLKYYGKPGITGLSQIKKYRGKTALTDRLATDIYYVENWSIWEDVGILLATPFCAFSSAVCKAAAQVTENAEPTEPPTEAQTENQNDKNESQIQS